jgi:hypothetical protein
MGTPGPNLFHRLHKWAHRQDENFLTESLAVVLEQLLVLAPAVATRLISRITGGFIDVLPEAASTIEIHTQVEASAGRPDLEIRTPHRLAWVEVKAESKLHTGQLEGYRVLLKQAGFAETKLLLLTRYPQVFGPDAERSDLQLRWFEVADWFEGARPAAVAGFLVRQFLTFLEARGMNLAHVGPYMPDGLRAMSNLTNMLHEAAIACKVSAQRRANWEDIWLSLDGKYVVGVTFTEPEKLWFGTRCQIDREKVGELGPGESIVEASWVPGRYRWVKWVELISEEVHFFARSKVSQMQWLERFLRDCLAKARSIETPGQASTVEAPEEGN